MKTKKLNFGNVVLSCVAAYADNACGGGSNACSK